MVSLPKTTASDMVLLKIGPKLKDYRIRRALLLEHSEYFRKALSGPWKEAEEGIVKLKDIRSGIFNIFVHWLYTDNIPKHEEHYDWKDLIGSHDKKVTKVRAHIFADRFQVPKFRQAIHNSLVEELIDCGLPVCDEYIVPLVTEAYNSIQAEHPILQLLVDILCDSKEACAHKGPDKIDKLPHAFLVRLARHTVHILHHEQLHPVPMKKRCYLEHESELSEVYCQKKKFHMNFNHNKEFGFFGMCYDCAEWEESVYTDGSDSKGETSEEG